MTTVAWDGRFLAADKRTSFGGLHGTTTKIHRVNGCLVGCCGNMAQSAELRRWLEEGGKRADFPSAQRDVEKSVTMLVIEPSGRAVLYENAPDPFVLEDRHWAIGSGRDFAIAAMHLGRGAADAVRVASHFDTGTGNGVDVLEFRAPQ